MRDSVFSWCRLLPAVLLLAGLVVTFGSFATALFGLSGDPGVGRNPLLMTA